MANVNSLNVLFQMAAADAVNNPPETGGPPVTVISRTISLVAFVSDINHLLGGDIGGDVLQYSGTLNYTLSKNAFSGDVGSAGGGKMLVTIGKNSTGYYTTIDVIELHSGKPPSPALTVSFAPTPPDGAASKSIAATQLLNIGFTGSGTAQGKTYSFSLLLDQYVFLFDTVKVGQ
jgi:hypothetical protein